MRWYHFFAMDGWIWVVCLVLGVIFWHARLGLLEEKAHYQVLKDQLEQKKMTVYSEKGRLQKKLLHCKDKDWIEWNLMYYLGLTPRGATKVLLVKEQKN